MEGDKALEALSTLDSPAGKLKLVLTRKEASVKSENSESGTEEATKLSDLSADKSSTTDYDSLSSQLEGLRVLNSQSVQVVDHEDTVTVTDTLLEVPSRTRRKGVDHATWLKKKKAQEATKKRTTHEKNEQKEATELFLPSLAEDPHFTNCLLQDGPEVDARGERAWKKWVERKRQTILKQQQQEVQMQRQLEDLHMQKRQLANVKFAEWYQKKELERRTGSKKKHMGSAKHQQLRKEMEERRKKLNYRIKWEDWNRTKSQQVLPKKFTHQEYPQPAWVNPDPWVD
ncbi:coiled-coil domain-containing protein 34-like [Cloeon dipterum]|uniref:coiled-coil domain-containing protein 34-like n=1 Tax=Cloeon dipterum TaxID=197152 RepID=UPI0032205A0D